MSGGKGRVKGREGSETSEPCGDGRKISRGQIASAGPKNR